MSDDLGDRMKIYEQSASTDLMPLLPTFARLDGRAFHTFTRTMERPFCQPFRDAMTELTTFLVQETSALIGYTQSDEITIGWYSRRYQSQIMFNGKLQKMVSILAALASAKFNRMVVERWPHLADRLPVFDCRVWNVPTHEEAANVFLWREQDATRNSLQMLARAHFSHNELIAKDSSELHDMLHSKGINWNDLPAELKRGTYVRRSIVMRKFTPEERARLPPRHQANVNPDLEVHRSECKVLPLPPLASIANRFEVLFEGAEPLKIGA